MKLREERDRMADDWSEEYATHVHPQLNEVGPDLAHLGQNMFIGMISC